MSHKKNESFRTQSHGLNKSRQFNIGGDAPMRNQRSTLARFAFGVLTFFVLHVFVGCQVATAAESDRLVVLMSIDGLANFYMNDPAAEMPTIRKLAAEGATAASMHASNPTV